MVLADASGPLTVRRCVPDARFIVYGFNPDAVLSLRLFQGA